MKTAVFTIVSLNYGAFAQTLMQSLQQHHPEWDRHVLVVDRCEDLNQVGGGLFTATGIEALPLPKMQEFLFRYDIMELNTAAKPYMFAHLRRQGYERVVYLDPDILVMDKLVDVERLLDEGAAAVVTPHLTARLDDGLMPNEQVIMRAGAYNLGFLAVGSLPASDDFIAWWADKLEYGAVVDIPQGLFTDQKWIDLAPGMFGGFAILRDPGYNLAYWNLPHRPVTTAHGAWFAGGQPLRFFHFSGFDPLNPQPFSKHQDRLDLDTIGPAKELALDYARRLIANGFASAKGQPYAFGRFRDGTPIPMAVRVLYRQTAEVRDKAGAFPFDAVDYFTEGSVGGLPIILRGAWVHYEHIRRAFPDALGAGRRAYYQWFADAGCTEIGIADAFVAPIRAALQSAAAAAAAAPPPPPTGIRTGLSIWARALIFAHKRATGGRLGHERLWQYQQVKGPSTFFKLGFAQFRASRWAHKVGLGRPYKAELDPMQVDGVVTPGTITIEQTERKHRYFGEYSGLYVEPGRDMWWLGRQARIAVAHSDSTKVRLRGRHDGDMHRRAHGKSELNVVIGFEGQEFTSFLVGSGEFDVTIDLKGLPEQWPAVLRLIPEAVFVPSEMGINADERPLSIQLRDIHCGAGLVFDVAASKAPPAAPSLDSIGVNVIGYARSEHGLGQSLRQFVHALDADGMPHVVIDFNVNNSSRVEDRSMDARIVNDPVFPINVFHINADQMPEAEINLPSQLFTRYNIGFWHWELPEMLEQHLAGFNSLNEVWVPTGFVQEAVAKSSPIPVVRMPHTIDFAVSPDASRKRFKLPEDTFLFLMMYDFSSYQERKNPQAALDAFEQAFATADDKVGLVIKTQNAQFHSKDVEALQAKLAGRKDIYWINETLPRQDVYDLQSVCDCLLSLHRSEGYGLGPAEAMFLGKPVIATNWSGNTEFMHPHNSLLVNYKLVKIAKDVGVYKAGQTWADPDVAHAASLMRQVVADPQLRQRISMEARRTMVEQYSPAVVGQRIRARLAFIQRNLQR